MREGQRGLGRQREAAASESQAGWKQAASFKKRNYLFIVWSHVPNWSSEGNLWELVSGVLLQ